jgi:hypothetical protein
MPICTDCHNEVDAGTRFCGNCGAAVSAAPSKPLPLPPGSQSTTYGDPTISVTPPSGPSKSAGIGGRFSIKSPLGISAVVLAVLILAGSIWWFGSASDSLFNYDDPGLYKVIVDGKWGFADAKGDIVIQPIYSQVGSFSEKLCPIRQDGKIGFIDRSGNLVISPQFDSALSFKNGLAVVQLGGDKVGFIDKSGSYVINPQFSNAFYFNEGVAPAQFDHEWGFIDKEGTFVIKAVYKAAFPFTEGYASVAMGNSFGFIDHKGKYVINPQFDDALPFTEGLSLVRNGNRWGFIDHKGKFVINPQYDSATPFHKGMSVVRVGDRSGVIDKKNKFVVNPGLFNLVPARAFEDGEDLFRFMFSSDALVATSNDGIGIMTYTGNWILPASHAVQSVYGVYPKVIDVQIEGERCLINKQGEVLVGKNKGKTISAIAADIEAEKQVVADLRTIHTAQITYASTYAGVGFADNLAKLGPANGAIPDANHAGLLDQSLATGSKDGYDFFLTPPIGQVTLSNYILVAKPPAGHSGRTLCTNAYDVIHYAASGQECDPNSSPVLN